VPIYEYVCDDCGKRYEQIVLSQSQKVTCPNCSSGRHTLQLSVFNAHTSSPGNGASAKETSFDGGSCACGAGGCGCN
jgi:putative FmdB family regulatory protein